MNEEDELDPKEQELKEEVDRYEAQNQEAFDMEEENEIRKRREGEGTRDFRDRISEGQYKANRKKQPRFETDDDIRNCLLYTSPSPRDATLSRMPSSA